MYMPIHQPRTRRKPAEEPAYAAGDSAVGGDNDTAVEENPPSEDPVQTYEENDTRLCNLCGRAFHTEGGFRSHLKVGLIDLYSFFLGVKD